MFAEAPASWPRLAMFQRRIDELLNTPLLMTEDYALTPRQMRLSPKGKQVWIAFHDALEAQLRHDGELSDIRDVASKAADNAARLAALFQMFESGFGEVCADTMRSATQVVAWHLHEARRVLPQLSLRFNDKHLLAVDQWLIRQCRQFGTTSVPKNDLRQKGPVRDTEQLNRILSQLVSLDRIRVVDKQRVTIEVNPALLGGLDGVA
jgi:putative DNA primase/helicase